MGLIGKEGSRSFAIEEVAPDFSEIITVFVKFNEDDVNCSVEIHNI